MIASKFDVSDSLGDKRLGYGAPLETPRDREPANWIDLIANAAVVKRLA